ncbi:MAG: hypothetical protein KAT16_04120 [Candidatus Heimdallarchaeota archaeon]|nr:hypothetical protein [Candidatus Heimdallarchaeota archaeon]
MSMSTTQIKLYGPGVSQVLERVKNLDESKEWKHKILYSGVCIGEKADLEISWKEVPTAKESFALVKYLDEVFLDNICRYTVTTSKPKMVDIFQQLEASDKKDIALTFLRLIGPSISQAITVLNENITEFPGIKGITGELIGRYDYSFEWMRIPEQKDIMALIDNLDHILKETGVIYTVVTKSKLSKFKTFRTEFIQPPEREIVHLITTRKL